MKKRVLSLICAFVFFSLLLPSFALGAGETVSAGSYGEGLLKFTKGKKVGYMDIFGNVIIKASFMSGDSFHNGMAKVQVSGGGYAKDQFINKAGKVMATAPKKTKTRYYGLCDTWEGDYATVEIWSVSKRDGSISPIGYNYINEKGKLLNDEEYQYAGPFREGYALVGKGSSLGKGGRNSISSRNEHWLSSSNGRMANEYKFIDKNGQQLGSLTWAIARDFHDGLAAVAVSAGNSLHWGFINSSGALQIAPEYTEVGDFEYGLIWVSDGENYGYINEMGDIVIPLKWKAAASFNEDGFAVVKDEYHAKIIDRQGNIVLDSEYSSLYSTSRNDRYSAGDGIVRGLIDREGNILVPLAFQYTGSKGNVFYGTRHQNALMICNEFGDIITPVIVNGELISEEAAEKYPDGTPCKKIPFSVGDEDRSLNLCMFTDEKGNVLSINMTDNMRGESFSIMRSDGKTLLFDQDGNRLGTSEWDGINTMASNEHVICVRKNDFYGFVDANTGETVVVPQYTEVKAYSDGVFVAMLGKNPAYLDSQARPILPEITKKSKKDVIKALQQQLADLGFYTGKINGGFNKQLTEAITAAQTAFGLEPSGLADSDFQYALQEAKPQ